MRGAICARANRDSQIKRLPYVSINKLCRTLTLLISPSSQAEAFVQGPGAGLALRRAPMVSANVNSGLQARRRVVGALRMQEEPGSKESTETKAAVDPYEVKKEVPSWAKEENQVRQSSFHTKHVTSY